MINSADEIDRTPRFAVLAHDSPAVKQCLVTVHEGTSADSDMAVAN